jgi:2-dehydropantoate 2-reductase
MAGQAGISENRLKAEDRRRNQMKIAIVGIGGVGGYFGGKLAREYENPDQHEIIFIARGKHLSAIKKNGLQLLTKEGDYIARPARATDNPAKSDIFDLVFFCTKSYSLESSALVIKANIHKNTVVIPLLNGVNIAQRLRAVLPDADILQGCVYISSFVDKPGVVRQTEGSCKLTFGTDDQSANQYQYILNIMLQAKIDATLTDKISQALWIKYLLICPLGSLTATTGKTFGGIIEDAKLKNKLREMIKEVKAIADARKIELPEDIIDKTIKLIEDFSYDAKTSMMVDRELGKKMEVDIFTAYVRQAGQELGIPTPLHNEIYLQLQ